MGAFYFFVKLRTNLAGLELVEILIKDYKIAAIPGEPFGMEKDCYLRVSYGALNTGVSEIGTQRLIKGLRETIG
jgi:aspartate/methionine/tyrosine aminotransferase